jgi:hypothetical protein
MGEKGIDPGAAQPSPGLGMAAMPRVGGAIQQMGEGPLTLGAPPPPTADPPAGDPVGDVVETILDPLGIHKLF